MLHPECPKCNHVPSCAYRPASPLEKRSTFSHNVVIQRFILGFYEITGFLIRLIFAAFAAEERMRLSIALQPNAFLLVSPQFFALLPELFFSP